MLRLAFDFIITWRETRTRPNAYVSIFLLMINICLLHLYVRTDQVNSKGVTDGLTSLPSLWPGVWSRKSL